VIAVSLVICQEWLDGARKKLSAAKPKAE
jgi:hypothetical protein